MRVSKQALTALAAGILFATASAQGQTAPKQTSVTSSAAEATGIVDLPIKMENPVATMNAPAAKRREFEVNIGLYFIAF